MSGFSRVFLRRSLALSLSLPPSGVDAACSPAASGGWAEIFCSPFPFSSARDPEGRGRAISGAGAAQGSREDADDGKPPLPPGEGLKSAKPRWLRVPRLGFGYESSSLRKRRWFLHWAEILCKSRKEGSAFSHCSLKSSIL